MQIWDVNQICTGQLRQLKGVNQPFWQAKNLPNDHLDLQIPIYDTDLVFMSSVGPDCLVACTAYGEIREYDTRIRKPAISVDLFDDNDGKNLYQ